MPGRVPRLAPPPIDHDLAGRARCADPRGSYTPLFFSDNAVDIARARAICSLCSVRAPCLGGAVQRREPFGVWGGEYLVDGKIAVPPRGRGRPPKVPVSTVVDEINGPATVAVLRPQTVSDGADQAMAAGTTSVTSRPSVSSS